MDVTAIWLLRGSTQPVMFSVLLFYLIVFFWRNQINFSMWHLSVTSPNKDPMQTMESVVNFLLKLSNGFCIIVFNKKGSWNSRRTFSLLLNSSCNLHFEHCQSHGDSSGTLSCQNSPLPSVFSQEQKYRTLPAVSCTDEKTPPVALT